MTVLPGPVKTKMTKNMNLPKFLTATPEHVSNTVFNSYKKNTMWFMFFQFGELLFLLSK